MGPTLYLLYTADLPLTEGVIIGTFADDTAALAVDACPIKASEKLQVSLDNISNWLRVWRIKANETKSVHVTFALRRDTCPHVKLNGIEVPQVSDVKYLGLHLDRRLTWRKHVFTKRKALGLQLRKIHWLLSGRSKVTLENKLLLYKCILKPVWTYGIQLWGTTADSNVEILQRFQSKVLRSIINAPWYVSNSCIHRDLAIPTVKQEIKNRSVTYTAKLLNHPNTLVLDLFNPRNQQQRTRRLKRKIPQDLTY